MYFTIVRFGKNDKFEEIVGQLLSVVGVPSLIHLNITALVHAQVGVAQQPFG